MTDTPNRGGRKPVEGVKRSCEVRLLLTPIDREALERLARAEGFSMSEYARRVLRAAAKATSPAS